MRYYLNSGLFTVIILFFFLPFIEIKCNESTLAKMSGFDLAAAGEITLADPGMMDYLKDNEEFKSMSEQQKKHPDPFTISVLVLSAAGLLLNLLLKTGREKTSIVLGGLMVIILFFFRMIFLKKWEEQMSGTSELGSYIRISLVFVSGYWLAMIGSLSVAGINIYHLWKDRRDNFITTYMPNSPEPDTLEEV